MQERGLLFTNLLGMPILRITLSFIGALILAAPDIIHNFNAEGNVVLIKRNLVFACLCLLLSFSRILVFTLLSKMRLSMFLISLGNSDFVEYVLSFCAGMYFVKSWEPTIKEGGTL